MPRQSHRKSPKNSARPSHRSLGIVKSVTSTQYVKPRTLVQFLHDTDQRRLKIPTRCVAGGCNSFPDLKEGIALHTIPFYNDDRPEARKRRKKWVNFVKCKRAKWEPTKTSAICSKHFKPEDFKRRFSFLPGQDSAFIPRLLTDDFVVSVFPTVNENEYLYLSVRLKQQ